jgi:hypothetical protein
MEFEEVGDRVDISPRTDDESDHVLPRTTQVAADIYGLDPLVWQRVHQIHQPRDLL